MRPVRWDNPPVESFRPRVIDRADGPLGSAAYFLRLCVDTPHRSLIGGLKPHLAGLRGRVLDLGAGAQLCRRHLPPGTRYVPVERGARGEAYGWSRPPAAVGDGAALPFRDGAFVHALCLEVLEHVEDPERVLAELFRVLSPGGTLALSVPFAAKWHFVPRDYWRFTPSGLSRLVARAAPFEILRMDRRGGEAAVILHFAAVACLGLLWRRSIAARAAGLLLLPFGVLAGLAANAAERLDLGSPEQTLGLSCVLRKPE